MEHLLLLTFLTSLKWGDVNFFTAVRPGGRSCWRWGGFSTDRRLWLAQETVDKHPGVLWITSIFGYMTLPYLQSECRKTCARSPLCASSPPSSPRVLNPLTHETEWRRWNRDESASSKQDVTAAASVQSAAAFNDLSGEQLSVHDYLYINSWVSWQSAVTSSDLHGMIIVPPRIQDDDVIEIDAKLENKHCCVFIWQMNFIRRKLKSAENLLHTEQLCFQFSVSGIRTALRCITIIYYDETRTERSRNHF